MKSREKYKKHNHRRQMKKMRQLQRLKKRRGKKKYRERWKEQLVDYRLKAPTVMSLEDNPSETALFFSKVFKTINKCSSRQSIRFDLSNVRRVTVDSIMYLIASINNSVIVQNLGLCCSGNMPQNKEVQDQFEKVGFYNYLHKIGRPLDERDYNGIKIMSGVSIDTKTVSTICDYVNKCIKSEDNLLTKRLYSTLVELMTNVKQHAYNNEQGLMNSQWYVFIENCDRCVKFVFLDTGLGIPTTIKKKMSEKIIDAAMLITGGEKSDPLYIEAVLNGEFRTETNLGYRGKGLPEIKEAIVSPESKLNNMRIVSGHGICCIDKNGIKQNEYVHNALEGTLFIWDFEKEVL